MEYNTLDKEKLIGELRVIHKKLVNLYEDIFNYKYTNDEEFNEYIKDQYRQNGISKKEQKDWNQNFCHRASYTLLNKILFVRICEDKGFMRNPEDYIIGEIGNPHIGEKLSRVGLQKWTNILTNYTFGELINFAFLDMRKSYSNIELYKDNKYEILNPTKNELNLRYIDTDENVKNFVVEFERTLNTIIEKLDRENFNFSKTDSNVLGDVYEQFMDIETRKAIGQFYTPEFVIEYILKNTISKIDIIKNPLVTVADISCGSGHFLIMAYDILKEKFIKKLEELRNIYSEDIYEIEKDGNKEYISGKEYWIEENIHYHLLKHCLYGSDIDSFAIQLTTINLLMKDLDNFTDQLNIIECDSLIKYENDFDWKDLKNQLEDEYETITSTSINLFGEEEETTIRQRKKIFNLRYIDDLGKKKTKKINRQRANEIIEVCEFWNKKFDYIVGNPPWGAGMKNKSYLRNRYKNSRSNINTFVLFIERMIASNLFNNMFGIIIPKNIIKANDYIEIRDMITKHNIVEIASSDDIFDGVTSETIILYVSSELVEKDNKTKVSFYKNEILKYKYAYQIDQFAFKDMPDRTFNIFANTMNINIFNKIRKKSKKLLSKYKIYRGIEIGKKDESLNDYKINNKYIPILAGKDVRKYFYNVDRYINTEANINFKDLNIYKSPKILIRKIAGEINASIDESECLVTQGVYILQALENSNYYHDLVYLNSNIMLFYYDVFVNQKARLTTNITIKNLYDLPMPLIEEPYISEKGKEVSSLFKEIKLLDFDITHNSFMNYVDNVNNIKIKIEKLLLEINDYFYSFYELNEEEIEHIKDMYNLKTDKDIKLADLDLNLFIKKHINEDKNIEVIAKEFNCNIQEIKDIQKRYIEENYRYEPWKLYNLEELYKKIEEYLNNMNYENFIKLEKYLNLKEIRENSYNNIKNIDSVIEIMRKEEPTKKSINIFKDSMNNDCYTWNAYRKVKDKDRLNKRFIKYYDSNYYGLSEWSDEIHKHYFLDAIEEYTETDPNEKKAKDILNLFKDLDIEDKKDYLSVIEGKINRVFK